MRALQEEAEDRYKSYTEYETARIKADCNSAVSECEERSRKELTDLRAELCKAIFKNGCVVTESDDIVYGGLRAADRKTHCLADDTLDTKLKEQKEWFLEHSGLSIEE